MFVSPPGYQPVYSPSIPYLGPIYGGLREGSSIYIQGSTPKDMTRFFVNLLCGPSESSDVALHFNPRFDGWDKVVFNTRQNGSWQSEEKIHDMPFSKGKGFELVIMVTSQGYQIKVNGKDFHTFKHRHPVERVCGIQIAGDVSIQTINVIGGGTGGGMGQGGYPGAGTGSGYPGGMGGGTAGGYPGADMGSGYPGGMGGGPAGGYPGGMGGCGVGGTGGGMGGDYPGGMGGGMGGGFPGSNLPGMGNQPVYNPPVPYSGQIPGGMSPKKTVIIRGMVPHGANRLSINFIVSRTRDVAFHMNPRVREGIVVRNTKMGGKWGKEDRELSMNPFVEGQYFDMSVRCGNQRFKVFVNGQHLFDYVHRLQSFSEVDILEIEGDVQISYIHF
ncbi:galectin-6-like isoform X3 [Xyrichtys novacula]|uniref:Galectin n=1 Tax=Xyrichtys novacula TaxID=13765 RepID=A0AAV1FUS1_XYRNO|nr:galectin-6-like isoform X3 [Xyrichtys novacula]